MTGEPGAGHRPNFITGMRVGKILIGIAGRWVERPIRPDVGDTGTPLLPTQLFWADRLGCIELVLGIRDTGVGFSRGNRRGNFQMAGEFTFVALDPLALQAELC